ncbi:hypothetical protein P4V41_07565 [Fictibacillus nanhaiensis]|uniref:hypothetical protein n=1 Tax=Fictibacillus nanhaiensis TaxID=742169 RepID=UPI002E1C2C72|nr:hypothetical protein [Fictibacillus nanhaiensis]
MSLKQALLETINEKWQNQEASEDSYLTNVTIHKTLAEAIKLLGEDVPTEFNPNKFNYIETDEYWKLQIEVAEQEELIIFHYE